MSDMFFIGHSRLDMHTDKSSSLFPYQKKTHQTKNQTKPKEKKIKKIKNQNKTT